MFTKSVVGVEKQNGLQLHGFSWWSRLPMWNYACWMFHVSLYTDTFGMSYFHKQSQPQSSMAGGPSCWLAQTFFKGPWIMHLIPKHAQRALKWCSLSFNKRIRFVWVVESCANVFPPIVGQTSLLNGVSVLLLPIFGTCLETFGSSNSCAALLPWLCEQKYCSIFGQEVFLQPSSLKFLAPRPNFDLLVM